MYSLERGGPSGLGDSSVGPRGSTELVEQRPLRLEELMRCVCCAPCEMVLHCSVCAMSHRVG